MQQVGNQTFNISRDVGGVARKRGQGVGGRGTFHIQTVAFIMYYNSVLSFIQFQCLCGLHITSKTSMAGSTSLEEV